jgi:hypothetical protein
MGAEEYTYGSHPIFQLIKCFYRMLEPPYVLGGVSRLAGYVWACLNREQRVPDPVREFIAREQIHRMYALAGMIRLVDEQSPSSSRLHEPETTKRQFNLSRHVRSISGENVSTLAGTPGSTEMTASPLELFKS